MELHLDGLLPNEFSQWAVPAGSVESDHRAYDRLRKRLQGFRCPGNIGHPPAHREHSDDWTQPDMEQYGSVPNLQENLAGGGSEFHPLLSGFARRKYVRILHARSRTWQVSPVGPSRFYCGPQFPNRCDVISSHKPHPHFVGTFSVLRLRYFGITTTSSFGMASSVALSMPRCARTRSGGRWVSHSESARS